MEGESGVSSDVRKPADMTTDTAFGELRSFLGKRAKNRATIGDTSVPCSVCGLSADSEISISDLASPLDGIFAHYQQDVSRQSVPTDQLSV